MTRELGMYGAAVIGLMVGSFANVCIYRLPRELSVVTGRSRCTRCGQRVAWYDNIPLLSFVLLFGRCRSCGMPFSLRYPLIEALMAITAWSIFSRMGLSWASGYVFCLTTAMVIVSAVDFEFRIIPDVISLPAIGIGLAIAAWAEWTAHPWSVTFREALTGAAVGAGLLWAVGWLYERLTGREGIGFGDVKLLALFGANVGVQGVIVSLFYGSLLGSFAGIFMILFHGKGRRYPIPFGPFLCAGFLIAALYGEMALKLPLAGLHRLGI